MKLRIKLFTTKKIRPWLETILQYPQLSFVFFIGLLSRLVSPVNHKWTCKECKKNFKIVSFDCFFHSYSFIFSYYSQQTKYSQFYHLHTRFFSVFCHQLVVLETSRSCIARIEQKKIFLVFVKIQNLNFGKFCIFRQTESSMCQKNQPKKKSQKGTARIFLVYLWPMPDMGKNFIFQYLVLSLLQEFEKKINHEFEYKIFGTSSSFVTLVWLVCLFRKSDARYLSKCYPCRIWVVWEMHLEWRYWPKFKQNQSDTWNSWKRFYFLMWNFEKIPDFKTCFWFSLPSFFLMSSIALQHLISDWGSGCDLSKCSLTV